MNHVRRKHQVGVRRRDVDSRTLDRFTVDNACVAVSATARARIRGSALACLLWEVHRDEQTVARQPSGQRASKLLQRLDSAGRCPDHNHVSMTHGLS